MQETQERSPVELTGMVAVKDVRAFMPAKFFDSVRNNAALPECCRRVDESFVQQLDTDGNGEPDMLVIKCGTCDRKQRRAACGSLGDTKGRLQGV